MEIRAHRGFTLIELITAMAVAGILLGVGVPSFVEAMKNSRTSSDYNEMVQALYLARSEAVKSSSEITVCARSTDSQCGSDWNNGWLVFVDSVVALNEATAQVSAGDEILSIVRERDSGNDFTALASTDRTASSATDRNYIRYTATGQSDWANGSILVCDERGPEKSRAINIAVTGDIRRGRTANGGNVPLDVFGRPISCP